MNAMNAIQATACAEGGPDMDRRPLSLARVVTSGALLLFAGVLSGCGSNQAVYDEAVTEAEYGLAAGLETTVLQTAELLATRAALDEISEGDIVGIFRTDATNYEDIPPNLPESRALFDIVENIDGSVSFSVFFKASFYSAAGLSNTNQSRHTCGTLTGRFTERGLTVADIDCPQALEADAGERSIRVPMTENAVKFGVDVGAPR